MKIELTAEQRIALKMLHKNSRDPRVRDRIRCVHLAADSWTTTTIAKSQLIDETTVRSHVNDWLNEEKLKPENGGSDSHLSKEQTAELISYLTDNLLTYADYHWEIGRIDEWWGIRYTVPGMNKWLYRNHFSYFKLTAYIRKSCRFQLTINERPDNRLQI